MKTAKLSTLPIGEHFKRKPDAKKVYQRGAYDRATRRYVNTDCADVWGNGLALKGDTVVYIGFDY